MRSAFLTLLLIGPALAQGGHDGHVAPATGPALSDVALFVMAALAVWLTRRALRRRHHRKD
ncbi:hypothetical protein [uncultured Sphingomonas sp.]|uniref:hypothetical protein n=1 Tax=uncultured Sphingomonas sp. TaxID=158754 RepID=UPI00258E0916|nr:hypothetical protein [uncultured Sphingomonas sp.]